MGRLFFMKMLSNVLIIFFHLMHRPQSYFDSHLVLIEYQGLDTGDNLDTKKRVLF